MDDAQVLYKKYLWAHRLLQQNLLQLKMRDFTRITRSFKIQFN